MRICVQGLWHLGSVTAACLASLEHDVIGFDEDKSLIEKLSSGKAPLFEPGLNDLLKDGINSKKLQFSYDRNNSLRDIDLLWITYDTPVDNEDKADTNFVLEEIQKSIACCSKGTLILVSSQLPVGTVSYLEKFTQSNFPESNISFAHSPENLRLGQALSIFLNPDRIVVGCRTKASRILLEKILSDISNNIEWMSVEASEMTKHAINSFLAISVVFANELASICEKIGVDAKQVARGLKTEQRIGPKAYLLPGAAFAGGTLARDINFLNQLSEEYCLPNKLLASVEDSNNHHKGWAKRLILEQHENLKGLSVALWGLSYKPGTDTLRRSLAVEIGDWLLSKGAKLNVHDPVVNKMPEHWKNSVTRLEDPLEALQKSNILIVTTEWPMYSGISFDHISTASGHLTVLDANGFLARLKEVEGVNYYAVGTLAGVNS